MILSIYFESRKSIKCYAMHNHSYETSLADLSSYQFGSMPVLEEAKTMVYVTNHNMITMAMAIFKTYKMADKGEEKKEY